MGIGNIGIKTDSIVQYNLAGSVDGNSVPVPKWNRVSEISANGAELTFDTIETVDNLCNGMKLSGGAKSESTFSVMSPRLINLNRSGLYSKLAKKNIASADFSNSNLTITRQLRNRTVSATGITINASEAFENSGEDGALGITTAFFEPFDAEKYSIHYSDGTIEKLTSDQVVITTGGSVINFKALAKTSGSADVNVTLKKLGIASRTKNYIRSEKLEVTKSNNVSTEASGLSQSKSYGLRVEDQEISLNVPDAVKVLAVYESTNTATPVLDSLEFVSGLGLDVNTYVGEQVI